MCSQTAKVVIVEDEFLVALHLEDILLDSGHDVVATVPDRAAADAVRQGPDVAFVDINLRDGPTGGEIAQLLCSRFGTRIVYVTANSGQIVAPAPSALGVVHKPFSRHAIESVVAYALDDTLTVARPAELQPLVGQELRQSA